MNTKSYIELKTTSILNVPLHTYDEFSFIVNGQTFRTSRLISDLLSPKISHLHSIDPTISEFYIDTSNKGDFSHIIELATFKRQEISQDELLFIFEIVDAFCNESIEINISDDSNDSISRDNAFNLVKKHSQFPKFYHKKKEEDLKFISSNLSALIESKKEELKSMSTEDLEEILSNNEVKLKDEDQLLRLVNELYEADSRYFVLYEHVIFRNVSSMLMNDFLRIFNISDITAGAWLSLSERLKEEVKSEKKEENELRYEEKGIKIEYDSNEPFEGIINHLIKETNGNIENELELTSSSSKTGSGVLNYVIQYNDLNHFRMKGGPNSWICFHFVNHRVNMTRYSIRSGKNGINSQNPKSWVIEGSNDNKRWDKMDEQTGNSALNGYNLVHSFEIETGKQSEYAYIRIRQTGKNWCNDDDLMMSAFEIHGILI